jgi:hypothetical protein
MESVKGLGVMTKYTINFSPGEIDLEEWDKEAEQSIKEIAEEFKKEFCMSEETVNEKSKVFCVNCKHILTVTSGRNKDEALCAKSTRRKTMDYVTGIEDYVFRDRNEIGLYGQYWTEEHYKRKRLFGIFPRKPDIVIGEKFWAKDCRGVNINGNCPTFEPQKEPVVQKDKNKEVQ